MRIIFSSEMTFNNFIGFDHPLQNTQISVAEKAMEYVHLIVPALHFWAPITSHLGIQADGAAMTAKLWRAVHQQADTTAQK